MLFTQSPLWRSVILFSKVETCIQDSKEHFDLLREAVEKLKAARRESQDRSDYRGQHSVLNHRRASSMVEREAILNLTVQAWNKLCELFTKKGQKKIQHKKKSWNFWTSSQRQMESLNPECVYSTKIKLYSMIVQHTDYVSSPRLQFLLFFMNHS